VGVVAISILNIFWTFLQVLNEVYVILSKTTVCQKASYETLNDVCQRSVDLKLFFESQGHRP